MCTAVTYKTRDFYFGRTLDYEHSYREEVTLMPRYFPLPFRNMGTKQQHYAILGMAYTVQGYPLYYDAINEKGLAMAGLNFVGYAAYQQPSSGKDNIAQFELIPWILCQCKTVQEAKVLLTKVHVTNQAFNDQLPPAQLHWLLADAQETITIECMKDGLHIHANPIGVLTNNPPFDRQMLYLTNFMQLSPDIPQNRFSDQLDLQPYSRGMGAMGLPGDLSSASRFVRAAFTKLNSVSGTSEMESVSQFFHILGSVSQTRGCCRLAEGVCESTIYTSCCNATQGIYYYTTYDNHQITAVDMHREDLSDNALVSYPLLRQQAICQQN